jgi:hypothetical protein
LGDKIALGLIARRIADVPFWFMLRPSTTRVFCRPWIGVQRAARHRPEQRAEQHDQAETCHADRHLMGRQPRRHNGLHGRNIAPPVNPWPIRPMII